MRVLHIAETAQGGVGSYLEEVVPLQARRYGADAVRVVLPGEHARYFPQLSREWLSAFELEGSSRAGAALRMASRGWSEVDLWQPDVVHLHSTLAGLVMRPLLAARRPLLRVAYCAHGWAFDRETGALQRTVVRHCERLLSRWSDRVLCVSQHELARARELGIDAGRVQLVRSGIRDVQPGPADELEAPAGWPAGALRVLFVGRLDRQKGVDVLYEAMRRLGDRAFALVVGTSVAGGGHAAREAPSNVVHLGWRSRTEIDALYAGADVLVVPSRWEALGLVALEAMRAGLPVVASRVGGLPEVVEDGCSGFIVEPNDPGELARVLSALDRPTLERMGVCARERFLRLFQVERVIDELDEAYCCASARPLPQAARTVAAARERP